MRLAVAAVLIMCQASLVYGQQTLCGTPEDCGFQSFLRSTCGWSIHRDLEVRSSFTGNYVVELRTNSSVGRLQSIRACSTLGATHCLRFNYGFYNDSALKLSVFVTTYSGTRNTPRTELVWRLNASEALHSSSVIGTVPLRTNSSFFVLFQAEKNPVNDFDTTVRIDNVKYQSFACSISPPSADPFSRSYVAGSTVEATVASSTANTESNLGNEWETSSSVHIAVIVGPVLAVIAVIGIVVVVLFVLRLKQVCCLKRQDGEDFQTDASYRPAFIASEGVIDDGVIQTQQHFHNQHFDTGAFTSPPGYYDVMRGQGWDARDISN